MGSVMRLDNKAAFEADWAFLLTGEVGDIGRQIQGLHQQAREFATKAAADMVYILGLYPGELVCGRFQDVEVTLVWDAGMIFCLVTHEDSSVLLGGASADPMAGNWSVRAIDADAATASYMISTATDHWKFRLLRVAQGISPRDYPLLAQTLSNG